MIPFYDDKNDPIFIADIFPPRRRQNRSFMVFTVTFFSNRDVNTGSGKGVLGIKSRNRKRQKHDTGVNKVTFKGMFKIGQG